MSHHGAAEVGKRARIVWGNKNLNLVVVGLSTICVFVFLNSILIKKIAITLSEDK